VRAIEEVAVDDGVEPGVLWKIGRAARIPAGTMALFRVHVRILALGVQ
jgi:hypothetical protein